MLGLGAVFDEIKHDDKQSKSWLIKFVYIYYLYLIKQNDNELNIN
jgi:hypothetical protein